MQDDLFADEAPLGSAPGSTNAGAAARLTGRARRDIVAPAEPDETLSMLAARLPSSIHFGTSSWHFPGWKNLVWDDHEYAESALSRKGLAAYVRHPLLRTVSLDRAFYRPLSASQYAGLAAQVPEGFRFVVKAPSLVSDALVRAQDGRGQQANPAFLDPVLALNEFIEPALEGLGSHVGALVFQLSPLPASMRQRPEEVIARLGAMLDALPRVGERCAGAVIAVEVRDACLLTPQLVQVLKAADATYCLGLHARMPPIEEQLPLLRALWPAPLVCRWNLHRMHGAHGYEEAKKLYEPFDRLVDEDPHTRAALARVVSGTAGAGWPVYVTINNKAEGSAPLSVQALAHAVAALAAPAQD
ncbi:MAG: DUF72 domain-containing protein [Burkholderiales bacterium]|nr:DUF72 domain-containing protein [Burkholderiales bacterium]